MRKKIPFTIAMLLTGVIGFTQKSSISLSVGPSFPIGSYGNKEISNSSSSGFAKPGPALNISFSHLIKKNWGLSLTAFGQRNNYDTKAMEDAFAKQKFHGLVVFSSTLPFPYPPSGSTTYPNWKFEKDAWWIGGLMAGGFLQFPSRSSQDFLFTIKAQAGAIYVESPETRGISITDTLIANFVQSGSHGIGFSYTIGAGVQYKISKKVYWITNLDFLGTNNILFDDVSNTTTLIKYPNVPGAMTVSQSVIKGSGKQNLQSINLTVGLGFIL